MPSVEVLRLEEGDVLVATVAGPLSGEVVDRLSEQLQAEFPGWPTRIVVGARLSILRSGDKLRPQPVKPNPVRK